MTKKRHFMATTATVVFGLINSAQANGQAAPASAPSTTADGASVQDIVVTAQLRRESGQVVPISVTAIGGDSLTKSNVASLQDLSAIVPGVVVSKSVSYGQAPISIRGLGGPSGGGSLFTDQPVAVYIDGVYVPALVQSVSDFLDVDTLQVLRGPQGTLYGRNSTAGAILITSKRPQLGTIGGYASAQGGSFDSFKISGALDLPIIENELGLRIAVGHNSGGDWARNTVDDRRFGGGKSTTVRGSLRWKPGPDATIDLIVDHSKATSRPATVALTSIAPAFRGPALGTVYVGNPYARRADFDMALNDRRVQIIGDHFTRTRGTDAVLQAEIGLGGVTLTSISGYRDFHVVGFQDSTPFTTPPASIGTNNAVQTLRSFSQELRLGSNGSGPFKWTLGAFYFHQSIDASIQLLNTQSGPPVATGFGPGGPIFAGRPAGTNALFIGKQKVDSIALFADATYDLTRTLSVTAGVRYSRDHKDAIIDNTVRTITNTVLGGPILSAGSCPTPTIACEKSYENVSPRAVVTYRPTDRNMLYASFSKGFNSGGFNNFGNVANPADPANPLENSSEKITNYEIGSKNDFFGRALRVNLSAFITDYVDLHIRQAVLTGGVAIVNVPRARVKGLELETTLRPIAGLTITANGSYLDGKLREGTLASLPTNTGTIVLGQNQTVVSADIAGNRLTRAPKWQGYASVAYEIPASFGTITPSVAWRGQTKAYYLETNQDSPQYIASGWSEVDLRLRLAGHRDAWEVSLIGQNVFDKRYITQIVPFSAFPIATLNTPRTWGASGTVRF